MIVLNERRYNAGTEAVTVDHRAEYVNAKGEPKAIQDPEVEQEIVKTHNKEWQKGTYRHVLNK